MEGESQRRAGEGEEAKSRATSAGLQEICSYGGRNREKFVFSHRRVESRGQVAKVTELSDGQQLQQRIIKQTTVIYFGCAFLVFFFLNNNNNNNNNRL